MMRVGVKRVGWGYVEERNKFRVHCKEATGSNQKWKGGHIKEGFSFHLIRLNVFFFL